MYTYIYTYILYANEARGGGARSIENNSWFIMFTIGKEAKIKEVTRNANLH